MKEKHIQIRIEQCLSLAKASPCPRRKLAALLLDPVRNVILMDGYNGGPRGGQGSLCGGAFCHRDGLRREAVEITERYTSLSDKYREVQVRVNGEAVWAAPLEPTTVQEPGARDRAESWVQEMLERHPGVKSGTHMEVGCHHAEMNVICNAAANGVSCSGAWMICLAEPCMMCAKMVHHAGIAHIIVVDGGYLGGKEGLQYLRDHGIKVTEVEGPKDPRLG